MLKLSMFFLIAFVVCFCAKLCFAGDSDNLQDICPTGTSSRQTIFINGFPCKNPTNITASDFKSSLLNHRGDTDNFLQSSTKTVTALEFPGLNTLGLSVARIDLDIDGLVMPHSHPRASEIFYVSEGIVVAGFVDTNNQLFQGILREGDVFVIPRGLLHYYLNGGFAPATIIAVLNSQSPGVVSIADAMFAPGDSEAMERIKRSVISRSILDLDTTEDVNLSQV
ncbi:germin-like protein subfamily 3 member 4 [Apium graveolens]|uniref:germin-like protein subfamily 3 member 4 n=1 Tax=Apium graveolens TaxID=4045 RepID=UPI003D7B47D4